MHTEHLQNVRPLTVVTGWLIAAAAASLVFLAFAALNLVGDDPGESGVVAAVAVGVGFGVGGFAAGFRALHAPILHGIAIGLTTLAAWFILNVLAVALFEEAAWSGLTPPLTAALLLEQVLAAIAGAWLGYRLALQDQPEPAD
ncbi:MAG: hypothetical protein ACRELV_09770 [Longimicrobiales bacterium]